MWAGCDNPGMAVGPERLRGDLVRLAHGGAGVRDFALGAARILARAVPFDGVCLLTLDPATRLPTREVVENGLPAATARRMAEIEIGGNDINNFDALARSERRAATLSQATGGNLDRSLRHRELRRPNGFGDELRAALVDDAAAWGAITLLRASDRENFAPEDATLVASVSAHLAEGLRRAMLLTAVSAERANDAEPAGLLLLASDNSITLVDAVAERWLAELRESGRGQPLPPAVAAVARLDARRGGRRADGRDHRGGASARARAADRGRLRADRARARGYAARSPGSWNADDRPSPAHLALDGARPPQVDLRESRREHARRARCADVLRPLRAKADRRRSGRVERLVRVAVAREPSPSWSVTRE
jgi:hypothetical protein